MSNSPADGRPTRLRSELFGTLADGCRRAVLRIASSRSPDGIGKDELAREVAAVTNDKPVAAVSDDEHDRALLECVHRLLPALTDAGLLEVDDDTVVTTDHWLYDESILDVTVGRTDAPSDRLDELFGALADSRRRVALSALAAGEVADPVSTETLARAVAAFEADVDATAVSSDRVDRVRISLVHVHLPTLEEAGLVGYDATSGWISYEGDSLLEASDSTDERLTDRQTATGGAGTVALVSPCRRP